MTSPSRPAFPAAGELVPLSVVIGSSADFPGTGRLAGGEDLGHLEQVRGDFGPGKVTLDVLEQGLRVLGGFLRGAGFVESGQRGGGSAERVKLDAIGSSGLLDRLDR